MNKGTSSQHGLVELGLMEDRGGVARMATKERYCEPGDRRGYMPVGRGFWSECAWRRGTLVPSLRPIHALAPIKGMHDVGLVILAGPS